MDVIARWNIQFPPLKNRLRQTSYEQPCSAVRTFVSRVPGLCGTQKYSLHVLIILSLTRGFDRLRAVQAFLFPSYRSVAMRIPRTIMHGNDCRAHLRTSDWSCLYMIGECETGLFFPIIGSLLIH